MPLSPLLGSALLCLVSPPPFHRKLHPAGSFWKLREMGRSGLRVGEGGGGDTAAFIAALCVLLLLTGGADAKSTRLPFAKKTLSGNDPLVIAEGGFSGVFPDSSRAAFVFALMLSAPDTSMWCNVQLTKDGVGICLPDIDMNNCTNITGVYPVRNNTYVIDGVPKTGWFPLDFNMSELQNIPREYHCITVNVLLEQAVAYVTRSIYSRSDRFDSIGFPILAVTDVQSIVKPSSVWLNVQHDIFYRQHGLNMRSYILSIQKRVSVEYISSPELGFLQSISGRVGRKTKLVFRFLDKTLSDPSKKQTYGLFLSNLTFIRTVASGIMVPKSYIWPVTKDNYLLPPTSIVQDAHNAGLEIYASDFANDRIIPYNYSYDPLQEYLSFTGDGNFSVDGVLTQSPITASEAIGCFSNLNAIVVDHGNPLIISHNGASGDYPDCIDLAYHNAIKDGADIIDCPIQASKDGVLMCMSSIDLFDTADVQGTPFSSGAYIIPEIWSTPGIFTFDLTWQDIANSSLRPKISSPESQYYLVRNPAYTNQGKFLKLSDFLAYANHTDLSGVMIITENAAFIAKLLEYDIVDAVTIALNEAGYNNQTTKKVMIQSKDSAVLKKLKQHKTKYKLVYTLPSDIGGASSLSLVDVKGFADAVAVDRNSISATSLDFIIRQTNLVKDLKSAGLAVYVHVFQNEFVSQPWDFLSDETIEINYYVQNVTVDGIITDFPKTVRRYKRNSCRGLGKDIPSYMQPVHDNVLANFLNGTSGQVPPLAPMQELNASSVEEPSLSPAVPNNMPPAPGASISPCALRSSADTAAESTCLLLLRPGPLGLCILVAGC